MKLRLILLLPVILLVSCGAPADDGDSFTFTAEDAEQVSQILDRIENEQDVGIVEEGADVSAQGQGSSSQSAPEEEVVINVADAHRFDPIRSELSSLEENTYRVTNAFLNVRTSPVVQAGLVESLSKGDLLKVVSFPSAKWAEVLLPDGRHGFVSTAYIAQVVSEDQLETIKKKYEGQYEVNFAFLNVRAEPKPGALKLGELGAHELVKPLSIDGEWAKILFQGKDGFVSSQYLKPYLPKLIVRQERFTIPVLRYRGDETGTSEALVKHLAFLESSGKEVITLREYYELLLRQQESDAMIAGDKVVLLISDVTKETIKDIGDALRASNVTATFFIHSNAVSAEGISPQLVKILVANGNDIGSAGVLGEDLRAMTNQQVLTELAKSRQTLEELTGKEVLSVAYPRGGVNERIVEQAVQAGYLFGVTLTPAIGEGFTRSQFLQLPSNIITSATTEQTLGSLVGVK
ncbi:MAG TPA: SH3 domain-containing protein [Candidatus Peribacterales bacterium]|nr:SH3 domain-containing protein [Candidatus Peribacterales bacterium]